MLETDLLEVASHTKPGPLYGLPAADVLITDVGRMNYLFGWLRARIATGVNIGGRSNEVHAHTIVFGKYRVVLRQNNGKAMRIVTGE